MSRLSARFRHRSAASVVAALALAATVGLSGCGGDATEPPRVIKMDGIFAYDFAHRETLVSVADDIFFARIDGVVETKYRDDIPETVVEVTVLENFKGDNAGRLKLWHDGGYSKDRKEVYVTEGGNLLEPGGEYLIAALRNKSGERRAVPKYGDVRLANESQKSQLRASFTELTAKTP
jgi:hypothetical protein